MPNGRCYRHGGPTPVGRASANFVHGRYSKLFTSVQGLGPHYEQVVSDAQLLELRDEIALTKARVLQLFEQVQKPGTSVESIWAEVAELFENTRKLVETQSKREKDVHAMISLDRVMMLVAYVTDSVTRHVTNRSERSAIYADVQRVLGSAAP